MMLGSYDKDERSLITEEKQNTAFQTVLASQLDVSTAENGGLFKVVAKITLSYHFTHSTFASRLRIQKAGTNK
jgi:hypothetical protein